MAIPAGIYLLAALASAGAGGYGAFQQAKSQEEIAAADLDLNYKNLGMKSRQHREEMRLKKQQQKMEERESAIKVLGGIQSLRAGNKPSSADFLSQLARS